MAATTLIDTGPLVALVDRNQSTHKRCVETLRVLSAPLITTWPCLTEAMDFLAGLGGWRSQNILWQFLERHGVEIHTLTDAEAERIKALMGQYSDTPMDLADASLVATAETRKIPRIFTLDNDFRVYRLYNREPFEVVP